MRDVDPEVVAASLAAAPAYAPADPAPGVEDDVKRVAAAIYREDDVWSAAIPYEKLDPLDQGAYERIAKAAIAALSTTSPAAMREAAAKALRDRIYPTNPEHDWTEFACIRAEACEAGEAAIRALPLDGERG